MNALISKNEFGYFDIVMEDDAWEVSHLYIEPLNMIMGKYKQDSTVCNIRQTVFGYSLVFNKGLDYSKVKVDKVYYSSEMVGEVLKNVNPTKKGRP